MSCLSLYNSLDRAGHPAQDGEVVKGAVMFCCTCLGPGRKGGGNGSWQELVFAKTPMAGGEPSTFLPTPLKAGECQETECVWSRQGAAVLSEPLVSFSATSLACPPLFLPFSD